MPQNLVIVIVIVIVIVSGIVITLDFKAFHYLYCAAPLPWVEGKKRGIQEMCFDGFQKEAEQDQDAFFRNSILKNHHHHHFNDQDVIRRRDAVNLSVLEVVALAQMSKY